MQGAKFVASTISCQATRSPKDPCNAWMNRFRRWTNAKPLSQQIRGLAAISQHVVVLQRGSSVTLAIVFFILQLPLVQIHTLFAPISLHGKASLCGCAELHLSFFFESFARGLSHSTSLPQLRSACHYAGLCQAGLRKSVLLLQQVLHERIISLLSMSCQAAMRHELSGCHATKRSARPRP